uniref:Uncharacterized protein n=1 Tax=Salix viminalis TaxID=40686 RepID=A0A6N2LIY6_SALVM
MTTSFAQKNDTVIIEVKNILLTENTAIQFLYKFVVEGVRPLYSLSVVPGKTFLARIGGLTALSALSSQIEGHN